MEVIKVMQVIKNAQFITFQNTDDTWGIEATFMLVFHRLYRLLRPLTLAGHRSNRL